MKLTDRHYLAALYSYVAFGPLRLGLLLKHYKSARQLWNISPTDLSKTGLSEKIISGFVKHRNEFDINKYFTRLEKLKIKFLTKNDHDYPKSLNSISTAPLVLYVLGDVRALSTLCVSIVGARKMTSYGRQVATDFATVLARAGITVVSGLALGIDAASHTGAVDAEGKSIAVLASGLNIVSPSSNKWIARKIIDTGGAIVSEYPLDYPPLASNFPNRNRIVSGLSSIIIVVEGLRKSGTIHTAKHAADQGKTVFAIPGQITSPMSDAPHFLIQSGAKIAFSPEDILAELSIEQKTQVIQNSAVKLNDTEKKIVNALETGEMDIDELVREINISADAIMGILSLLELKGVVTSSDNKFRLSLSLRE